jgi:exodeoxyribonuclease VII large subunit
MDDIGDTLASSASRTASNIPEYAVSELSVAIKRTLEGAFGRIRVRGEITELKSYSSGHTYLSLKDDGGKVRAVIWKSSASRIGLKPENGVEVIATGKISSYGDRSEYQLIIERLEYAGIGALLARIEMLKTRLAGEGLFDADRKQALPRLPTVIGVITSASGAVLHDIQTTIARRFHRPILLWPVPVQGEGAAEKIAEAIAGMDRLPAPAIPRPDVLIVARGGGSLDDLMAFNDEAVVRAAAACRLPLISAVGHETDTTLIDFAADRRAPTPTAAAELAVPVRAELIASLAQTEARLVGALVRTTAASRASLEAASARLPDLPSILGNARIRADDRAHRLALSGPNLVAAKRAMLQRAERHLQAPDTMIGARRHQVELASLRLLTALRHAVQIARGQAARLLPRLSPNSIESRLKAQHAGLAVLRAQLEGASYERVLARGFALVRHRKGGPVTAASAVKPGSRLTISFADGDINATADRAPINQSELAL